jgi:hypothetical protein
MGGLGREDDVDEEAGAVVEGGIENNATYR